MFKQLCIVFSLLLLVACDPVDTGDPPTFSSYSVTAVNEDQLLVSWSASSISDDLVEAENLRVRIWVAGPNETLDANNLGASDFTTDEGALSFSIIDLEPGTEYQVLARAIDRVGDDSENTDIKTVSTTAANGGSFDAGVETTLNSQPNYIFSGRATDSLDNLGVALSNSILFYTRQSDNSLVSEAEISVGSTIRSAHMVPVQNGQSLDDLFVLSDSGVIFYRNGTNMVRDNFQFIGTPVADTFRPFIGANTDLLDHFCYVAENGNGYVYYVNDGDDADTTPFFSRTFPLQNANAKLVSGDYDGDGNYDIAYFSGGSLIVNLGNNITFDDFQGETTIDELTGDDVGSGGFGSEIDVTLWSFDANNDNNEDLILFVRNESQDLTRTFVFAGRGDGTFNAAQTGNHSWSFYERPIFQDALGDGRNDLLVAQTSSNNIAIFPGPSNSYASGAQFLGINGTPYQVVAANLDGSGGPEILVLDRDNNTITTFYGN